MPSSIVPADLTINDKDFLDAVAISAVPSLIKKGLAPSMVVTSAFNFAEAMLVERKDRDGF